jgi:hypothetical protein
MRWCEVVSGVLRWWSARRWSLRWWMSTTSFIINIYTKEVEVINIDTNEGA